MFRKKSKKGFRSILLKSKKKRWRPRKKKTSYLALFLILLILFVWLPSIFAWIWFKDNILEKLPDVDNIEKVIFSQTTKITDRNWVLLYKIYNENRKYIDISEVSTNMQNAIIAMEDKNFRVNPWVDFKWIVRAGIKDLMFGKRQWASTITQQLIKNLLLTNERTITRKLKELVLVFKLDNYLSKKINKQYKWLNEEQTKKKVKEKILEMYLNYIFFGNNSYWIEAASSSYFQKSAKNLNILESAILASIPKSPARYSPSSNRTRNMWELSFYLSWDRQELTWTFKTLAENSYIEYLKWQSFALLKQEDEIITMLSPKNLYFKKTHIKYTNWRKDYVLARMYLESMIDKNQFIQAIKESLNKQVHTQKVEIKAPWFVFSVIEELEKKYWKELIEQAWWTIKTSLDYNIQTIAETVVKKRWPILAKNKVNNSSLVYLDSQNWDIIAYVWSKDYYDKSIDWQVDMISSRRQCWSVIKPLIYANAFVQNPSLTPESPIYDTKFEIADKWNTFNNFDWKFRWLMDFKRALWNSRNIPASKMYFLWWAETKVKNFLKSIWLDTISDKLYYGYPLWIWAVEVKMINMAKAYSHLSAQWSPAKINPILEIKWPEWNLIYKKKLEKEKRQIPISVVSFMRYILSNPANRPASWNSVMQIAGFKMATKSWTTNIIDKKTWRKLPRDWWFIGYTPSKVFVSWAWNTKWEPMWPNTFGWRTAWKIRKDFIWILIEKKLIENEDMELNWTTYTHINSIDGKKATKNTPTQVTVKTLARIDNTIKNSPEDSVKMIKIDTLCNGLVSEYTPESAQKYAYIINWAESYNPWNPKWQKSVSKWWESKWIEKYEKIFNAPVLLEEPKQICEDRLIIAKKWTLKFDITYPENNQELSRVFDLRLDIKNKPFKIKDVKIYIDNNLVQTSWFWSNVWVYLRKEVNAWRHSMIVKITDEKWYTDSKQMYINIIEKDTTKPYLEKIWKSWDYYFYIFKDKHSRVLWWSIICDWIERRFQWPIAKSKSDDCKYRPVDYYWNQ